MLQSTSPGRGVWRGSRRTLLMSSIVNDVQPGQSPKQRHCCPTRIQNNPLHLLSTPGPNAATARLRCWSTLTAVLLAGVALVKVDPSRALYARLPDCEGVGSEAPSGVPHFYMPSATCRSGFKCSRSGSSHTPRPTFIRLPSSIGMLTAGPLAIEAHKGRIANFERSRRSRPAVFNMSVRLEYRATAFEHPQQQDTTPATPPQQRCRNNGATGGGVCQVWRTRRGCGASPGQMTQP